MNGLLNIDPFSMPVTSGLLQSRNTNVTNSGMSQDPLSGGLLNAFQQNPSAGLMMGAALLQASAAGQSTGAGVGTGLAAFSQALAQAEQQKQQNRLAQLKTMEMETNIRRMQMGAFEGTGLSTQMANMQAQRYIQQGMSPQDAFYKAGQDVMATTPVTTTDPATGAIITMNRNPLPYVGMAAPSGGSPLAAPASAPLVPVAPMTDPQAAAAVTDLFGSQVPPANQNFTQALTQPAVPAPQSAPLAPVTNPYGLNPNLTPIEQRTKSVKETEQAVDKKKLIDEDGASAAMVLGQAEQALNVLNSGFEGGKRSELLAEYFNLVGNSNPTPEQQKFLQDYAVLERYSGNQTLEAAKALKPLSDSDLAFARDMSGKPGQNPEILRTKIMIDYAVNTRKQQKAELASQWEAQYGSLAKRSPDGLGFEDYAKQALGDKLVTPEMAQRFGAMFYVNGIEELEKMNMPPGTKAYDMKTKKMLVVE